jgi:hypothetical protein
MKSVAKGCAVLGAVAIVTSAVSAAISGVSAPSPGSTGVSNALFPVSVAAMGLVGAFVAARRPTNPTGWLFIGGALFLNGNAFAQSYAREAVSGTSLPGSDIAAWLGLWTWMPAMGCISLAFILFPDGHPPSRRWRWVVIAIAALSVATAFVAIPTFGAPISDLVDAPSPAAVRGGQILEEVSAALVFALPVALVAIAVRFRRARGIERLQMKWFVFGASFVALAALIATVLAFAGVENATQNPLQWGSLLIGLTATPVAAGIAILRYRLYDIDRIISRTFSYAIVTVLLAAAFGLVTLVPTTVVGSAGKTPDWLIALGTLAVAGMFRPVRRRVQSRVDRHFNRSRYDAQRIIDGFSARMREQLDADALTREVADAVSSTVHPARISVWMRPSR